MVCREGLFVLYEAERCVDLVEDVGREAHHVLHVESESFEGFGVGLGGQAVDSEAHSH